MPELTNSSANKIKLIYILANSHSGSTLLGFYVGALNSVLAIGELKMLPRIEMSKRICTCGKELLVCPVWSKIYEKDKKYLKREENIVYTKRTFFKILLDFLNYDSFENRQKEVAFLTIVNDETKKYDPKVEFLLDTSKSLWRLKMLEKISDLEINVIYLERNFRDNLSSFIKRGKAFWNSYFRLLVNNLLMRIFLRKTKLPFIKIQYESFVDAPKENLQSIMDHFNISPQIFSEQMVANADFHFVSGNPGTRKQFLTKDHNLQLTQNTDQYFKKWQLNILNLLGH